jgi:hypothetical protein
MIIQNEQLKANRIRYPSNSPDEAGGRGRRASLENGRAEKYHCRNDELLRGIGQNTRTLMHCLPNLPMRISAGLHGKNQRCVTTANPTALTYALAPCGPLHQSGPD